MKNIERKLLCFMAIPLLFACSNTEPEIAYVNMRLVYFQNDSESVERYSFFVIANDEDGIENLADLYLYHDLEGLQWHLSEKDWVVVEQDGHMWIGTRSIAMTDDEPLPRGQYRAVLMNKGGEQAARTFTFDPPARPRFAFPTCSVKDGKYAVSSNYPSNSFIGYTEQGDFVQTIKLSALNGDIGDLKLQSTVRSVGLWAEDSSYSTSVLLDALSIK
ncbi:MAG: hypothetical protein LBG05_08365 [Treponema sp.]|jgi:hypothetical protein|nr:hypothetical protein [Treponema sp.]